MRPAPHRAAVPGEGGSVAADGRAGACSVSEVEGRRRLAATAGVACDQGEEEVGL